MKNRLARGTNAPRDMREAIHEYRGTANSITPKTAVQRI